MTFEIDTEEQENERIRRELIELLDKMQAKLEKEMEELNIPIK